MIVDELSVGLVVERRMLTGQWGGHAWRPMTVFAVAPEVAAWTPLGGGPQSTRFYAGEASLHLFSTDTANYRDNLASGDPKLWVVLRPQGAEPPVEVHLVTADPAEGEASTEAGDNVVETVAMPPEIAAHIAAFIEAHHVERPFHKRKRDRAKSDPGWRGGGGPGGGSQG
jgi:hypothetical protein